MERLDLTHDLLNPHQHSALAITLRQVEKTLRSILHDLVNEEQAILYQSKITLPEDKRPEVKQLVEAALEQIVWLAQTFELPPQIIDNTATLRGPLALLRSDLYDAHAAKLRRFGDVNPDLEAALDPTIDHLIELLAEITRVAQS
ncbi:MAG: hypothetical protein ACUVRJ_10815 [Candidatus Villigracilaceae bacterium]